MLDPTERGKEAEVSFEVGQSTKPCDDARQRLHLITSCLKLTSITRSPPIKLGISSLETSYFLASTMM